MSETVWWIGAWVLLALYAIGATVLLRRTARGATKQTPLANAVMFLIQGFWGGWFVHAMMIAWTRG